MSSCTVNTPTQNYVSGSDAAVSKTCRNLADAEQCKKHPDCKEDVHVMGRCRPKATPHYCPGGEFSINPTSDSCVDPSLKDVSECEKKSERRCLVSLQPDASRQKDCSSACADSGGACGYCVRDGTRACVCRGTRSAEACQNITDASACKDQGQCAWHTDYNEPENLFDPASNGRSRPLICATGSAVTDVCGSGTGHECTDTTKNKKVRTAVRCEALPMGVLTGERYTKSSGNGFSVECDADDIIVGICLSGSTRDCHGNRAQVVCEKTHGSVHHSVWNRDVTERVGTGSFQVKGQTAEPNVASCPPSTLATGICNGNRVEDCRSMGPVSETHGHTRLRCGKAAITAEPPFSTGRPDGLYDTRDVHTAHCCLAGGSSFAAPPFYLNTLPHEQCDSETRSLSSESCRHSLTDTSVCTTKSAYESFPECRRWCNEQKVQEGSGRSSYTGCDDAARAFCQNNPLHADCRCLATDPPLCGTSDAVCTAARKIQKQCWWKACSSPTAAKTSELLNTTDCPDRIDFCVDQGSGISRSRCDQAELNKQTCQQAVESTRQCAAGTLRNASLTAAGTTASDSYMVDPVPVEKHGAIEVEEGIQVWEINLICTLSILLVFALIYAAKHMSTVPRNFRTFPRNVID